MKQTDGRAITNPENAQSFTHAEIKQAADEMNPDGVSSAVDAWSKMATAVTNAGHQFETAIKKAIEQHWEGAAAEQAVRGIRDYATRVGEFGESLHAQSTPLSQASGAAAKFKASVPPVVDTSTNPRGPELRNAGEEQARDDMTTHYIQPYGTTAPAIPTLPPPINPVSAPLPSTGTGTGSDTGTGPAKTSDGSTGSSTSGSGTSSENSGDAEPGRAEQPTEPGSGEAQPSTEPAATQAGSSGQPTDTATTPAATTTAKPTTTTANPFSAIPTVGPAATLPSTPSNPSTVASAAVNGTPNRPSTPTFDRPSGVAGPVNEPGTSRPASPATTPGATGTQSAPAPVRAGTAGVAGYSGMVPPGVRARGKDDDEHKAPGYLRTEEHAKELLGEVKPTVPPVIGVE
ncbi:hypothetical protein [Nocardia brasiliensis]|uniref:hypothetical protein n=1 Tax=Nocardia brasiliensis TaxID=37326 RepID=UPI00189451E8|nr:hypothetical protein [Nocardia brasiliensis]MBF6124320.1 hypothetical protein [Nocardia brasiliensis]